MDWMMGIGDLVVFASAFVAAGAVRKSMKMKQEVDLFADQVEEAIEQILSGKEWKETTEVTEDTLWGKCGEKFWQLYRVWNRKEADALLEKRQMKALISDISHQTKTPLANMKLYQEFLQEEALSEKGKESGGADRETGIPFAEYDKNVKAGNWNYSDTERARKSLSDIDGGGQSDCSRSGTKRN